MPAKMGRVSGKEVTPLGAGTVRSFSKPGADVPQTLGIKLDAKGCIQTRPAHDYTVDMYISPFSTLIKRFIKAVEMFDIPGETRLEAKADFWMPSQE
ncbi:hypothetical protein WISP_132881 [Willisornis vidua]|uniref:Uncharacterized protein n=1 Tax=Willisornis vidua TaxID=1566151 RepID=A0ABQ9CV75_9PASS|nr:hypothetical protein WISP_132881 [Willisornis vidua]